LKPALGFLEHEGVFHRETRLRMPTGVLHRAGAKGAWGGTDACSHLRTRRVS
jgi:hypothetical protein